MKKHLTVLKKRMKKEITTKSVSYFQSSSWLMKASQKVQMIEYQRLLPRL